MPQVKKVTRRIKSSGAGQNIDFENSQKSTALDSIILLQALQKNINRPSFCKDKSM
jgi:hypothetical protein